MLYVVFTVILKIYSTFQAFPIFFEKKRLNIKKTNYFQYCIF